MNEFINDNFSSIIAMIAIISPIATAIINNIYQSKIKKLEINDDYFKSTSNKKITYFEEYVSKATTLHNIRVNDKYFHLDIYNSYKKALNRILLYTPINEHQILFDFDNEPENIDKLNSVIILIKSEIEKLQKGKI